MSFASASSFLDKWLHPNRPQPGPASPSSSSSSSSSLVAVPAPAPAAPIQPVRLQSQSQSQSQCRPVRSRSRGVSRPRVPVPVPVPLNNVNVNDDGVSINVLLDRVDSEVDNSNGVGGSDNREAVLSDIASKLRDPLDSNVPYQNFVSLLRAEAQYYFITEILPKLPTYDFHNSFNSRSKVHGIRYTFPDPLTALLSDRIVKSSRSVQVYSYLSQYGSIVVWDPFRMFREHCPRINCEKHRSVDLRPHGWDLPMKHVMSLDGHITFIVSGRLRCPRKSLNVKVTESNKSKNKVKVKVKVKPRIKKGDPLGVWHRRI